MNSNTFFGGNGDGAGADYVKDAFQDVTLSSSHNSGLTDTALTNPQNWKFGNDDVPKMGHKVLWVKDLVLLDDRSKWVNQSPTYQVVFHESFDGVKAYAFGTLNLFNKGTQLDSNHANGPYINFLSLNAGIGITGKLRRVAFLLQNSTGSSATGQVVVDGVNGNTIDFSSQVFNSNQYSPVRYAPYVHAGADETNDLHDIQLKANQANGTMQVVGVIVYFSATNIDCNPGSSYVNKTKYTTVAGTTLTQPALGSSLGGNVLVYKTTNNTYATDARSVSTLISTGSNTVSTSVLNVQTGHGASFKTGYGVIYTNGSSTYVSSVLSIATDALTMANNIGFGGSGSVYVAWKAGPSVAIGATLYDLSTTLDFNKYAFYSTFQLQASLPIYDPQGQYCFFSQNTIFGRAEDADYVATFKTQSGFMQIDGYFSAAQLEWGGTGLLNATMCINGTPAFSVNQQITGPLTQNVMVDAGPGWNSINIGCGPSMAHGQTNQVLGLRRIHLYTHAAKHVGITFGGLASYDQRQALTQRDSYNATMMAIGLGKRVYADQLPLKGGFLRGLTAGVPGGIIYAGFSTNIGFTFGFYGKNFALLGTGASGNMTIDGVSTSNAFNTMKTVSSEGFHTVGYAHLGATLEVFGIDIQTQLGGLKQLQSVQGPVVNQKTTPVAAEIAVCGGAGHGSTNTKIRVFVNVNTMIGTAITLTQSAANGWAFTINEPGLYAMFSTDLNSGVACNIGISKNSTNLTTAISSLSFGEKLVYVAAASGNPTEVQCMTYCNAGDTIRAHTDGTPDITSDNVNFRIVQVARAG